MASQLGAAGFDLGELEDVPTEEALEADPGAAEEPPAEEAAEQPTEQPTEQAPAS